MYHLPNDYADIVGTGHCPVFEYGFSSLIFEFSLLGSSYSAIVQIDKLFHNANLIKFVTSGPKAGNFSFTLPPQPKVPRIPISVRWNIRDGQFNMPFTSGQLTIPVSGTQKQPPPPPPCTPQTTDPHIVIRTCLAHSGEQTDLLVGATAFPPGRSRAPREHPPLRAHHLILKCRGTRGTRCGA